MDEVINQNAIVMDALHEHPFFAGLSDSFLQELVPKVKIHKLLANDVLFHHGDTGDSLFIIKQGHIKVYIQNAGGEDITLNEFKSGDSFGEMTLVDEQPRSASAKAIIDSELYELKRVDFIALITENPLSSLDIIRDLSDKLRFAIAYIQKAIDWSQHIAEGDYQSALGEIETTQSSLQKNSSDEARAGAFLAAFFRMITEVKDREDKMKEEVIRLRIEIDEARKEKSVTEIIESTDFEELRRRAQEFKRKRK